MTKEQPAWMPKTLLKHRCKDPKYKRLCRACVWEQSEWETARNLVAEIEKQGIWAQVKYKVSEKEETMWCLPKKFYEQLRQ